METRLIAILLSDLSGYTEFSARADRGAIAASIRQQQSIMLPIIANHRGRLVKWIGDAALVVFGSATDAILCGRKIQTAFVEGAERGTTLLNPRVKVVVHVGDVNVDSDGDIYGDAVNFTARMEKAASADEVYFSETVRRIISRAEIPYESVGRFEFKGIPEPAEVYRTCFGQTPVVRERLALVQTNFVGIQDMADELGWDVVHPVLDEVTDAIVTGARRNGGTNRGVMQTGCFLSFDTVGAALRAVGDSCGALPGLAAGRRLEGGIKIRSAVHWGTLHVMKHTMMGRDIDIVRTLAALGFGEEVLLTDAAVAAARAEGLAEGPLKAVAIGDLRECRSRSSWSKKFQDIPVYRLSLADAPSVAAHPSGVQPNRLPG